MANIEKYIKFESGMIIKTKHPEYHKDGELMTMVEGKRQYIEQAKQSLLDMLKPGQIVYCIVRSVSASGMLRQISLKIVHNGQIRDITYNASTILGWGMGSNNGIKVSGCGMDMAFHTVYTLACIIFKNSIHPENSNNDTGYWLKSEII